MCTAASRNTAEYAVEPTSCVQCTATFLHSVYYRGGVPVPQEFTLWVQWSLHIKSAIVLTRGGDTTGQEESETARQRESETREQSETGGRSEGRRCDCKPVIALGFYEVSSTALYLSQFCVHPNYRGRGLVHLIVTRIISQHRPNTALFSSTGPTKLNPTLTTRRFAVRLSGRAEDAPKTAGIFRRAEDEVLTVNEGTRKGVLNNTEDRELVHFCETSQSYTVETANGEDSVEILQFINKFQSQWSFTKPLSANKLDLMLSPQFRDLFKVVVIRKYDNRGMLGVFCIQKLTIRTSPQEVRTTALLTHIAWSTPHTIKLLLDTIIRVSCDTLDALVVNECYGLGRMLEEDGRFVDMSKVGVVNHVYVRDRGEMVEQICGSQFGMTLFD